MVNLRQIRDHIIEPALQRMGLYSPEAADLVLFTGLQESGYKYLKQLGTGPALSFWQVEPYTANDIFETYLKFRDELEDAVESFMFDGTLEENLIGSLPFAVAMCRIKYRRSPMPLPSVGNGPGMAHIWKQAYNTPQGAGREIEFINQWEKHKQELA
jgi:hypothetical protein